MHRLAALLFLVVLSFGTAAPARAAESSDGIRVILLFVVEPSDEPSRKGLEFLVPAVRDQHFQSAG